MSDNEPDLSPDDLIVLASSANTREVYHRNIDGEPPCTTVRQQSDWITKPFHKRPHRLRPCQRCFGSDCTNEGNDGQARVAKIRRLAAQGAFDD